MKFLFVKGFSPQILNRFGNFARKTALLCTIIGVFVPFSPVMPASGPDPSWVLGLNKAIAQGLSYGKELIFTFGPYASIYTKAYFPSTFSMTIGGSVYLAISYWMAIVYLMKSVKCRWVITFCGMLAGAIYSRDALFFSYPLLAGLACLKIIFLEEERPPVCKSKLIIFIALLFAPFGLLPLIKGSMLILCSVVAVLCSLMFVFKKENIPAVICLTTPVISIPLFWVAADQSLSSLPDYFIGLEQIISGYTAAMAIRGRVSEVIVYLVTSTLLLFLISTRKQTNAALRMFLFLMYFLFLFVSFKNGFVRHDHHAVTAGTSILIAVLLLPFVLGARAMSVLFFLGLLTTYYINSHYLKMSYEKFGSRFASTYQREWYGLENEITNRNWLLQKYHAKIKRISEKASLPIFQGTTDIYPYNQAALIASGNSWAPRPVFQSYSAYTPALAEINREHLMGGLAPDNVIFKVRAIDGRIPSLEDGPSWPGLLRHYRLTMAENGYLFLRRKNGSDNAVNAKVITNRGHRFGENVYLPRPSQPIFAQIHIRPTFLGRVANILFKSDQLQITFHLKNGTTKRYRIIPGMAEAGFLMSPLIETTTEFGLLYGKKSYLAGNTVEAFSITPKDGKSLFWQKRYTVTLKKVNLSPPANISKLNLVDQGHSFPPSQVTFAKKCYGNIDEINGVRPGQKQLAFGLLNVRGWLATSIKKAISPKAAILTLTDTQGNHTFFYTKRVIRSDVGAYFNQPALERSGFAESADVSALSGHYNLGLAVQKSGQIEMCRRFKVPVIIKDNGGN